MIGQCDDNCNHCKKARQPRIMCCSEDSDDCAKRNLKCCKPYCIHFKNMVGLPVPQYPLEPEHEHEWQPAGYESRPTPFSTHLSPRKHITIYALCKCGATNTFTKYE